MEFQPVIHSPRCISEVMVAPSPPPSHLPLDFNTPESYLPCSLRYSPPFPVLLESYYWFLLRCVPLEQDDGHGHHRQRESSARGASSGGRTEGSLNLMCWPSPLGGLVGRENGEIHMVVQALVRRSGSPGSWPASWATRASKTTELGPLGHQTNKRQAWVSCPPCSISGSPHVGAPK
jgi:hypothetical protein